MNFLAETEIFEGNPTLEPSGRRQQSPIEYSSQLAAIMLGGTTRTSADKRIRTTLAALWSEVFLCRAYCSSHHIPSMRKLSNQAVLSTLHPNCLGYGQKFRQREGGRGSIQWGNSLRRLCSINQTLIITYILQSSYILRVTLQDCPMVNWTCICVYTLNM